MTHGKSLGRCKLEGSQLVREMSNCQNHVDRHLYVMPDGQKKLAEFPISVYFVSSSPGPRHTTRRSKKREHFVGVWL